MWPGTECICPPAAPTSTNAENPYNSRVLVHNWFEDRRQYHQECPRCTGHSITKTDYLPYDAAEYKPNKCIPPVTYATKSNNAGVGWRLLLSDHDQCEYMENYMTTYDLMHNWDVRRAGCKPKPMRRWKLIMDAIWQPQPDNAVAFGNLTTIGYRKAPQLPLVPRDWHTYQTDTTYRRTYVPRKYPDDYVICHHASHKCIRKSTEDMILTPKIGVCDNCRFNVRCDPCACSCRCHLNCNPARFPTLVPQHTLKNYLPCQNLHPAGEKGAEMMKNAPPDPAPGFPIYDEVAPSTSPCDTASEEYCARQECDRRYRQGPCLDIDKPVGYQ